jgi:hypothetical protein
MKTTKKWNKLFQFGMFCMVFTFGLVVTGCKSDEEDNSGITTGDEIAIAKINLPSFDKRSAYTDALVAQTTGYSLVVTKGGIEVYNNTFPASQTVIQVELTPGNHTFILNAMKNSEVLGTGTTAIDLVKGENNVNIILIPLVVEDEGTYANINVSWQDNESDPPLLSANIWVEGSLAEETEQWFSFNATATRHYIHLNYTGLGYAYVQVYTDLGIAIGDNQRLSSGYGNARPDAAGSFSRELEIGHTYYIRVQQAGDGTYYKGTYRIALTETGESPNMTTLPVESVVPLAANTWTNGETDSGKEQWYSFTANASNQYVHILPGTATAFWIQMYGGNGGTIGDAIYAATYVAGPSGPWELETGNTYYIRFPSGYHGTFQIAINDSTTPPPIILPTEDAPPLSANTWTDGTISGGEWYRFTANAATQYIHFDFTTATGASVNVYDSTGNMVGTLKYVAVTAPSFSRAFTNGSVYYLHVTQGSYHGAFRIAFSASEVPPAITLPIEDVTEITANTWTTTSIPYDGKQWFRFTANASTQYIHVSGVSYSISLRLYDANGNAVGSPIECGNNSFLSQAVTSGQVYYVKAEGVGSHDGNYKISFNASETPPILE